jgi:hypothetical protein
MVKGTLVDVGIKGSEGRVVVTCSHCVLPNPREHEEFSKWQGKI